MISKDITEDNSKAAYKVTGDVIVILRVLSGLKNEAGAGVGCLITTSMENRCLKQDQNILQITGWFSPDAAEWCAHHSRLESIYPDEPVILVNK